MHVTVAYLGGARGQSGVARDAYEVGHGATIADVARLVGERHPNLGKLLTHVRWARNFELASLSTPVDEGDEVGLLPPVAGGAPRAEITGAPLDVGLVQRRVQADSRGGSVLFVGTVRNHAGGRAVQRITYEAYEPMASRQLQHIADALSLDDCEVSICHRVGTLEVGEIAVVIASAAPHREAAFNACRTALEEIKRDVAIWKREESPDGDHWVGWGGG